MVEYAGGINSLKGSAGKPSAMDIDEAVARIRCHYVYCHAADIRSIVTNSRAYITMKSGSRFEQSKMEMSTLSMQMPILASRGLRL